jgi:hypothetical protein
MRHRAQDKRQPCAGEKAPGEDLPGAVCPQRRAPHLEGRGASAPLIEDMVEG